MVISVVLWAVFVVFLAMVFSAISIKSFLKFITKKEIYQPIRESGPESHLKTKKKTPTFGGVFIITSVLLVSVFFLGIGHKIDSKIVAIFALIFSFSAIGLLDDLIKVKFKNINGFRGSKKLILEFFITSFVMLFLQYKSGINFGLTWIPFFGVVDFGVFYPVFAAFIVVGAANSTNLTDGLDGLLGINAAIVAITFAMIGFYIDDFGVITISLSLLGSLLGFLMFNKFPAKIFMGDVGSLGIGAILAVLAILSKTEFIFAIMGLVFILEAASVVIQVSVYKLYKKRVFKMAPIHHHFEIVFKSERKVVRFFSMVTFVLCLLSLLVFTKFTQNLHYSSNSVAHPCS